MNNNQDYTLPEFLAVVASREIKDNEKVFVGIGIPLIGALLAKMTHAPNAVLAMESGSIGPEPRRLFLGIGDNACVENAIYTTSLWRLFSDMQCGFFDLGIVGGAQVDKYGNLNSTCIFGDGDYFTPASRLPGSGGANDIASSARRTIFMMPLEKRRFLNKVDYITSPGFIDGPDARQSYSLPGGGPEAIITNKCIFRFDQATGEAYLDSLKEGVEIEEVKACISWELKVASDLKVIEPPSKEQIELIRRIDPTGIYLGDGLAKLTFDSYIKLLGDSF